MNENENAVNEKELPLAENVEQNAVESAESAAPQTTEQTPPKTYTDEEVNAIVGKRLARQEARIRKEYDRKYGDLEEVLRANSGKEDIGEITSDLRKVAERKGITIPEKPKYNERDIETLAHADAAEIIRGGFEEVVEETDRLAAIGVANMTARDKAMFRELAEYRQNAERANALSAIGVTEDVYNSAEFQEFAAQYRSDVPITKVYEQYQRTQPKKEIKPMGSMKSTAADSGVKDFYSVEEARKFSKDDLDKNPALYNAILKSMQKWK
jgi:hypothetical protein